MPFKSKAQAEKLKKTQPDLYQRWMQETPEYDSLPERLEPKQPAARAPKEKVAARPHQRKVAKRDPGRRKPAR